MYILSIFGNVALVSELKKTLGSLSLSANDIKIGFWVQHVPVYRTHNNLERRKHFLVHLSVWTCMHFQYTHHILFAGKYLAMWKQHTFQIIIWLWCSSIDDDHALTDCQNVNSWLNDLVWTCLGLGLKAGSFLATLWCCKSNLVLTYYVTAFKYV